MLDNLFSLRFYTASAEWRRFKEFIANCNFSINASNTIYLFNTNFFFIANSLRQLIN